MATHSSILAGRIPWTEEPGKLQSMGSQRVGHDLGDYPKWVKISITWPLPSGSFLSIGKEIPHMFYNVKGQI